MAPIMSNIAIMMSRYHSMRALQTSTNLVRPRAYPYLANMTNRSRAFDDLSNLLANAAGAVKGLGDEAKAVGRARAEKMISDLDLVTRDEFDILKARLDAQAKEIAALREAAAAKSAKRKPAAKKAVSRKGAAKNTTTRLASKKKN